MLPAVVLTQSCLAGAVIVHFTDEDNEAQGRLSTLRVLKHIYIVDKAFQPSDVTPGPPSS